MPSLPLPNSLRRNSCTDCRRRRIFPHVRTPALKHGKDRGREFVHTESAKKRAQRLLKHELSLSQSCPVRRVVKLLGILSRVSLAIRSQRAESVVPGLFPPFAPGIPGSSGVWSVGAGGGECDDATRCDAGRDEAVRWFCCGAVGWSRGCC